MGHRANGNSARAHQSLDQRPWNLDSRLKSFPVRTWQQEDDLRGNPIENEQDENANRKRGVKCSDQRMGIPFEMLRHRQIVCSVWNQASDYKRGQRNPFLESGMDGKNCRRM